MSNELLLTSATAPAVKPRNAREYKSWAKEMVAGDAAGAIFALPSYKVDVLQLKTTGRNGYKQGFGREKLAWVDGRYVNNSHLLDKNPAKMVAWANDPDAKYVCDACGRDVIDVIGARELLKNNPAGKPANFELLVLWPHGGTRDQCTVCGECARDREHILLAAFHAGLPADMFCSDGRDVAGLIAHMLNVGDAVPALRQGLNGHMNPDTITRAAVARNGWDINWHLAQYVRTNERAEQHAVRLAAKLAQTDAVPSESELSEGNEA